MSLCRDFKTILAASGSEVQICVDVAKALGAAGTRVRVVSMPCWELFEAKDKAYQLSGEIRFSSYCKVVPVCAIHAYIYIYLP